MPCQSCGEQYVSGLCQACARAKSRDGDIQDRLGGYDALTDGGPTLTAELEDTASQHANDALAAMDARETEEAEYHARQFLQAIIGINQTGGEA
jgi:hypothetical protein